MRHRLVVLILAAVLAAGCQSTTSGSNSGGSNSMVRQTDAVPPTPPQVLYVADFAVAPGTVTIDQGVIGRSRIGAALSSVTSKVTRRSDAATPAEQAQRAVAALSAALVEELTKVGLPARRLPAGSALPGDGWLLQGQFARIEQGNRLQQSVIGFGQGSPEIEVSGTLGELGPAGSDVFLNFGGNNDPRRMPGGIVTRNPYAMAARFVMAKGATDRDITKLGERLADDIVAVLKTNGVVR